MSQRSPWEENSRLRDSVLSFPNKSHPFTAKAPAPPRRSHPSVPWGPARTIGYQSPAMHSPSPWLASRTDPEQPSPASPQLRSCYFSCKSKAPLIFLLTMLSSTGQHKPPFPSLAVLLTTQPDQDNPSTNTKGLSHHPHPAGSLGCA